MGQNSVPPDFNRAYANVLGSGLTLGLMTPAPMPASTPADPGEARLTAKVADRPDRAYERFVDRITTALDLAKVGDGEAKVARVMLAVDRLDVADRARLSKFVLRLRHHYLDAQPGRFV